MASNVLPNVVCFITGPIPQSTDCDRIFIVRTLAGKGPLRDYYMDQVEALQLKHVRILSVWLAAEDYPALLGLICDGRCA